MGDKPKRGQEKPKKGKRKVKSVTNAGPKGLPKR